MTRRRRFVWRAAPILLALVVIAPVALLVGYAAIARQAAEDQYLLGSRPDRLRLGGALISTDIGDHIEHLQSIAADPRVVTALTNHDTVTLGHRLRGLVGGNPQTVAAFVLDRQGVLWGIAPETPDIIGQSLAGREYFTGLAAGNWKPYISEGYQSRATGSPRVVTIAVAIPDPANPIGMIGMGLNLDALSDRVAALGMQGPTVLVDKRGRVVGSAGGSFEALADLSSDQHVRLAGPVSGSRLVGGVLTSWAPVAGTPWRLVSWEPRAALIPASVLSDAAAPAGLGLIAIVLMTLFARHYARLSRQRRLLDEARGEAEMRRAELAALVESVGDGLIMVDADGRLQELNGPAARLLGVSRDEALGMPASDLRRLLDRDPQPEDEQGRMLEAALAQAGVVRAEVLIAASGRRIQTVTTRIESSAGDRTGLAIVLRDVTAERELEEAKDELIGHVSHELRSPMAAILGFCELLLDREYTEEVRRKYLRHVHSSAERLTELLNGFLDTQRLQSGKETFEISPVDVLPAAERVTGLVGPSSTMHRFELDIPAGLPPVLADPAKLEQILLNLLTNAVKYSPGGGVIRVAASEDDGHISVSVSDQGLGFEPEAGSRLFTEFYRVRRPGLADIKGTGLGLAIVRKLLEAQGGTVKAESPGIGQGSVFTFRLPSAAPVEGGGGQRILLVEDDVHFAGMLAERLRDAGYSVHRAARTDGVLERARRDEPDAILLDLLLPGATSGWDLLSALKGDALTREVPVVVVSGLDEAERGLAAGADRYLTKPVEGGRLLEILADVMASEKDVLVVEDDPSLRQALSDILRARGFRVRQAADGAAALSMIAGRPPGLVLLDLGLPEVDGYEVLDRLRESGRSIPVIVVTGMDLGDDERARLESRVQGLVQKRGSFLDAVGRSVDGVL